MGPIVYSRTVRVLQLLTCNVVSFWFVNLSLHLVPLHVGSDVRRVVAAVGTFLSGLGLEVADRLRGLDTDTCCGADAVTGNLRTGHFDSLEEVLRQVVGDVAMLSRSLLVA